LLRGGEIRRILDPDYKTIIKKDRVAGAVSILSNIKIPASLFAGAAFGSAFVDITPPETRMKGPKSKLLYKRISQVYVSKKLMNMLTAYQHT